MASATWLRVALGVALLLACLSSARTADKDAPKSADDIMEAVHGEGGLRAKIAEAVRYDKIKDAKKPADEWVKLAAALREAKPPRGKDDSWKKLASAYETQVKGIAAAVKDEKTSNVRDRLRGIAGTCNGCHNAHKKH